MSPTKSREPGKSPEPVKSPEQWATKIGVILAVAGSAVGLGNFLRFPGQAAQNGGGAFMIPYFIAFLLLGVPICWAEWTIGRHAGARHGYHSAPGVFYAISGKRVWAYLGSIGVLIPLVIYMYYIVIESWCLTYAVQYLTGTIDLGTDPSHYAERSATHFANMTGLSQNGFVYAGNLHPSVFWCTVVFIVNFTLIYFGITKGIESFCKVAMPLMAICALVVLIRVLTLGTPNPELPDRNVINGLGFMWNPKGTATDGVWYAALLNPQTWIAAAGQIFFSLSVGFGIIINYSSYLRRRDDVVLSGLTASSTNQFFEVCLGGLITIPAAFIFLGAAGAVGGTFGLGFNTLPVVFLYMPGGWIFGFLWFFMLFLAAITSSLSMLQPAIAFLEEGFNISRKKSVTLLGLISTAGAIYVMYFSKDLAALDTMDFWVGTMMIYVLATLQVILFAWVLGAEKGRQLAEEGAEMKLPRIFPFIIKYVSPTYLLIMFGAWCVHPDNLPARIKSLSEGGVPLFSVGIILAVLVALLGMTHLALKRWEARGIQEVL
ncbi:MAG: sodium-dependent transporter [Bdellovibrionales bacterium]|nr:sodium-dependent transporter [Bdellovibrionales bacterium]